MNSYIETSINDYYTDIEQSSKIVVLYFYTDDCISCAAFNQIFENLAEKYNSDFKFVKLQRQTNRQLADKLNVRISPTVIFIKDGKETCSRLSGYIEGNEFKAALEKVQSNRCNPGDRKRVECDVLIIGGGPAGLSAAIYTARAKLLTVILDEGMAGGQVTTTYHVANYPGTNGVVRGLDLADNMKKQALSFGAHFDELKEIQEISLEGNMKSIKSEDTEYFSKTVIIATGAQPRKLPAEGESEFRGRGLHYCATCDGALYQDADIIVVGGGNSALDESIFLMNYAKHVTIIQNKESFTGSKSGQDKVEEHPDIDVLFNTSVVKLNGDHFLKSVTVEDVITHSKRDINADGVFVYIGMEPKTKLFEGLIDIDEYGYIIADEDMKTNLSGVFAAGDVRQKKVRQIATAVSDGVIAAVMAEKFINK